MRSAPVSMSEDAAKRLTAHLESCTDFRANCVHCDEALVGSLKQMREHECKEAPDEGSK
jgi:hypothetical protein